MALAGQMSISKESSAGSRDRSGGEGLFLSRGVDRLQQPVEMLLLDHLGSLGFDTVISK